MTSQRRKLLKNTKGREVVYFTTPSGVEAVVDASIPPEALENFAKSLAQKIAAQKNDEDRAARHEWNCD